MKASELRSRLSEAEFQEMVIERARAKGWLVHHDRGDYRQCIAGDPGFPDLVMARKGRVIFAELKSETGRLTTAQRGWLESLLGGPSSRVWRPSDWPEICEALE